MPDVLVVGGGIAGLASAWFLQQAAARDHVNLDIRLLEASERLGGKIVTQTIDGFVCEGGPDSIITQSKSGLELIASLGLTDDVIPCNPEQKRVYVLRGGKLVPLAGGFRLTVPTGIGALFRDRLLSWPGKLAMLRDLFVGSRSSDEDESLGSFVRRRFGREALERIGGPLMAGIYVSDPELMSMKATFPQFLTMEKQGSLIRAFAKRARQSRQEPEQPLFVSLKGGLQQLVDAMTPQLDDVHCNTPVRSVQKKNGQFEVRAHDGSLHKAKALVLATPADRSCEFMRQHFPHLASQLAQIRFVSTATLSLAFKTADVGRPLDGYGFVVPSSEPNRLLACTWTSSKFAHRSPEGCVLLRAFIGGPQHAHLVSLSDADLLQVAMGELRGLLDLRADPLHTVISRWPTANPQYDVGHLERVARIDEAVEAIPGLHIAGSSFRGIGIPHCIDQGRKAAEEVYRTLCSAGANNKPSTASS